MDNAYGAAVATITEAPKQGDPLEHQVTEPGIEPATTGIVEHAAAPELVPAANYQGFASDDEIAARAYELYVARGYTHGADMDDWLEAERSLRSDRPSGFDKPID